MNALADDCDIELADEVIMTNHAAFEFDYDDEVEYAYAGYFKAQNVTGCTDDQIVDMLKVGGSRLEKTDNMFGNSNLEENSSYVLAYVGFNAEGERGNLYLHPYKTKVAAEQITADVTKVQYDSQNFYYTIDIDDDKVLEYYALTDVGDNLQPFAGNVATLGLVWKQLIEQNEEKAGQHYTGDTFAAARPNGEKSLLVSTWARDYDLEFSGVISQGIWNIQSGAPKKNAKIKYPNRSKGNKQVLMERVRKAMVK